ncbi:MAG: hypothetical protein KFH98_08370 [Gemmatimonadetes bacterium]|nr:hypothetical protein [Gemmatimonadota bacterium]
MRYVVALLTIMLCTADARGQQPRAAVVPQSITVGDVFHAAVRIDLPDGMRLAAPDSLELVDDVESAGRREVTMDTAGGSRSATLLYPLAAWRPGSYELPPMSLRLIDGQRDTTLRVQLPPFEVTSVLPADTSGIEAKPAKDVIGANRLWWPILLALLIAALIATALYIWWKRRRAAEEPVVFTPAVPPLEIAIAQLAALRRGGLAERGEFREFYGRLTETLRHYAAATETRWSVDLTTSELATRLRADIGVQDALEVTRILGAADMVKFARAGATKDDANADLDAARAWVERMAERQTGDEPEQRMAA